MLDITSFPATLGRDPSNTVQIDDEEISRFHSRIKCRGKLFIIEDLNSQNGTYLNGDKILNAIIQNEDKILIGTTELVFRTRSPELSIKNQYSEREFSFIDQQKNKLVRIGSGEPYFEGFDSVRVNFRDAIDSLTKKLETSQKIFNYTGDFLVKNDLKDTMFTLLKIIGQNVQRLSRAVIMLTNSHDTEIVPIAFKDYTNAKREFAISQEPIIDVVNRRQPVLITTKEPKTLPRKIAIVPIISNATVIAIVQLESDHEKHSLSTHELAFCQAVISRVSPIIDNILLRQELDSSMVGFVETMVATIEAKDTYTVGHSERVSRYSMAIAEELKLNRDIKKQLMISSLCHDLGKIGIPDLILKKASLLSNEEYEEMKLHPIIGAKIIEHMPNAKRFISGVKYHHEKWDGTGYPEGLIGENIPFFGRIIAIADAFDAMISGRSYSGFIDEESAVHEISQDKDLFDPEIVKAFTSAWNSGLITQRTGTNKNISTNSKNNFTKLKK